MPSKSVVRTTFASLVALGISLVVSAQVAAGATWAMPVEITPDDAWLYDGCRSKGSALAAYSSGFFNVAVKRSNDGGASWRREVTIEKGDVRTPAIACRGRHVDVVWLNGYRLRYTSSHDGGRTFNAPRRLSPWQDDEVVTVDVARGPGGMVVVAWTSENSDNWPEEVTNHVRVRVSRDGGETFGSAKTVAAGSLGTVAVGDGVIYVSFMLDSDGMDLSRSTDGGQTWKPPVTISERAWEASDIVAQGPTAYVGFTRKVGEDYSVAYRSTADKGASWQPAVTLGSKHGHGSGDLRLNLDGDLVQAVFLRCGDNLCNHFGRLLYRQSTDNGATWTTPEFIDSDGFFGRGVVGGVVFVDRPIVLYNDPDSKTTHALSRFRSP